MGACLQEENSLDISQAHQKEDEDPRVLAVNKMVFPGRTFVSIPQPSNQCKHRYAHVLQEVKGGVPRGEVSYCLDHVSK